MAELQFGETATAGYDKVVGTMTRHVVPPLLRAAGLAPGMRVLDVATGTGIAAEPASAIVGPLGQVVATDISPAMLQRARERLGRLPNVTLSLEDGQRLSFGAGSFDAVLCNLGLMYFPDPALGLSEFHRVLRGGGRAAVSVNTTAQLSLVSRVLSIIARHVPSKAAEADRLFALGDAAILTSLFRGAGYRDIETATETHQAEFPSFDAYFSGIEAGSGNTGQEYTALPDDLRRVVREETRADLGDTGGPIMIEVTIRVASGRR